MKLVATHDLLNGGLFSSSVDLHDAWNDVTAAVAKTDWPHGSGKFSIYPESGKKRGKGNGVKPVKLSCMAELRRRGWAVEAMPPLPPSVLTTGDLDALKSTPSGYVAFEWETGNISSSHRALNKLCLGISQLNLLGGFLVVPSDRLKMYLTDRIGNIGELRPYFPLWSSYGGARGALRIVVVEHDVEDHNVPKIPKGTDGRALV